MSTPPPDDSAHPDDKLATPAGSSNAANEGDAGGGDAGDFESLRDEAPISLWAEFLLFIRYNKKWWLTPILLVLAILGILVALAATGAAPFIYPF